MGVVYSKKKKVGNTYESVTTNKKMTSTEGEVDTGEYLPTDQIVQVHIEMGNTVNTGNYASSKFTVGITMPSSMNSVDNTYEYCQNWVNDRLEALNTELQELLDA